MAWYRYLGVNSIRMFGGNGGISTLRAFSTGGGGAWGTDLHGAPVTSLAAYRAAVVQLRTPAGHVPTVVGFSSWVNPPLVSALAALMNATSTGPTGGSLTSTVSRAQQLGMSALVVDWLTCGVFSFSTLDQTTSTYWAEHWELYKMQYIMAGWAYSVGVNRLEFWNEPDLNAQCVTAFSWPDFMTVQAGAIQDAFADANADVASGTSKCTASCPLSPLIHVSALASSSAGSSSGAGNFFPTPGTSQYPNSAAQQTYPSGSPYTSTYAGDYYSYLGMSSMQLEHAAFPAVTQLAASLNVTAAGVQNMNVFSIHTYGKTGWELQKLAVGDVAGMAAARASPVPALLPTVPWAVTEHAAHTTATWNTLSSTADTDYEAARLGGQLLYLVQVGGAGGPSFSPAAKA